MTDVFRPDIEMANSASTPEPPRAAEYALTLLDLLSQHRRQFVRLFVTALTVFTIIAFLIPKYYEATARLMPPDQNNSGAAMLGLAIAFGFGGQDLARKFLEKKLAQHSKEEREDELSPL